MAKKPEKVVEDHDVKDNTDAPTPKVKGKVYTYVGGGEDSPRVIEFMGVQKFVRGQATEVTHPTLLRKLENHPCFTEGEVDEEDLHAYDLKEKERADAQRKQDAKTDAAAKRLNSKWAGKGDKE